MEPDGIRSLPLRVRPHPDESLPGLLVRTATANRLRGPQRLLRVCGMRRTVAAGAGDPAAMEPLGRLLALPPERLLALSFAAADGTPQILGHRVPGDFVAAGQVRFCPRCLDDACYHRAWWALTLATACPIHAVRLVERCPRCQRTFAWHEPSLERCRCGVRFSRLPAAPVAAEDLGGLRAVHDLLRTPPDRLEGLAAELGVGDTLRLIYGLGCMATGTRRLARPLALAKRHPERAWRVLDAGWRACQDWPASFHRFLDDLRAGAPRRPKRFGLEKAYGPLPEWLGLHAGAPYAERARAALLEHAAAIPVLATRAPAVLARRAALPGDRACMTFTEACKTVGVSDWKLRSFAARHGLFIAGGGKGEPLLLDAAVIRSLADGVKALADRQRACAVLGVGPGTFDDLGRAGLLPPPAAGLAADLLRRRTWPIADLERIVDDVAVRVGRRPRGRAMMSLAEAACALGPLGLGMATVLGAIADGRLRPSPAGRGKRGLRRFAVPADTVRALRDELGAGMRRTLSLSQAAGILDVKTEVAYAWARRGLLPTAARPGERPERGRRVGEADLESFRRDYVTASELRGRSGLGASRKLALTLIARGATPVSGPSVDGARQYLFRRAEVDALLRGA
ncbi:TniQ family protein [Azospirillum argentinense]